LLFTVRFLATGVEQAWTFNGFPFDGPFQLFNPLRRIADGQIPGRDFENFHGLLIPYLHFPLYVIAGADLRGSEFARQVLTPVLSVASVYSILTFATASRQKAIQLLGVWVCVAPRVGMGELDVAGNSLLGFRAAFPLFAVAYLGRSLRTTRSRGSPWRIGALLGIGVLWSWEQGTAITAGVALAMLIVGPGCLLARLRKLLLVAVGAVASLLITVGFLTAGNITAAWDAIRYMAVDVPGDQLWYFGSPPNPFVRSLGDVVASLPLCFLWLAAGTIVCATVRLTKGGFVERPAGTVSLALAGYAITTSFSYIGAAEPRYLAPGERALMLSVAMLILPSVGALAGRNRVLVRVVACGLVVASVFGVVRSGWAGEVRSAPERISVAMQGPPAVGPGWALYSEAAEKVLGEHTCGRRSEAWIWSTYSGLLEAERKCFNPSSDYIIHSLGRGRRSYSDRFRITAPTFVQTAASSFPYENWIRSTHWSWYEQLLERYEPIGFSYHSVFWGQRKSGPAPSWSNSDPAELAGNTAKLVRESGCDIVVVHLAYSARGWFSSLPFLDGMDRVLVSVQAPGLTFQLSVDPAEHIAEFPIIPRSDVTDLSVSVSRTTLLPGGNVRIDAGTTSRCVRLPAGAAWRDALLR